jgi:hypothetical protein
VLVLIRSIVKTGLYSSKPHTGVKVCDRSSTVCMIILKIIRPLRHDTRAVSQFGIIHIIKTPVVVVLTVACVKSRRVHKTEIIPLIRISPRNMLRCYKKIHDCLVYVFVVKLL